MARISVFVIISLIVTIFYCLGLIKFLTDVGDDRCEMTYMYEYPQFIRITNSIDKRYPKYGLYAYGEGRLTSRVRNMNFDGIPVMFIPGNAGSHKQVRSLSSVALRKALDADTSIHFDYFTLDLNDEFSGLYGPLLYDQLEYANHSFYRIFELYKEKRKPRSIVLIGHSMGGVIAKKLLSQLPESNMVPVMITLASPLKRAPVILDPHLKSFYNILFESNPSTTVINLSGGYRDFLIPTYLSNVKNGSHINVVTSNIPMTWIENNHVQILWCKQLVLALNRALFDSVDPRTNFLTTNSSYIQTVFKHHLKHHSGIKIKNLPLYSDIVKLDIKGKWIESLFKQYTIENLKGVREPHWYMVKLTTLPGNDILNVLALNLDIVNWVYVCNANFQKGPSRVCMEAYHLTQRSEIAPSIKYKRRFIQLNLKELYKNNTELSHVVFRTLPTNEPIIFHVDIHSHTDRDMSFELPKWWSTQEKIIFESTPEKTLNWKVHLAGLYHVIQYYDLFVEPTQCSRENHHASVTLVAPWAEENRHAFFTSTEKKPFDVRLYSSKPGNLSETPYLKFILDPSCTYKISIKTSLIGSLGQVARFYTPLLLTNVAVVILLALKYQLLSLKEGQFPIIFTAISHGPRGYYLLTLARIFTQPLKFMSLKYLPKPDIYYLVDDGLDFFVMPFVLYVCSVGIVWFLSILYGISLFTLESTANKLALKLLTRTFIWSNYFMTFLQKVPVVVAGILVFLSFTTCGSLALCLGTVFYFLRLTQMSQDFVEDVIWLVVEKFGWRFLNVFFKTRRRNTGNSDTTLSDDREQNGGSNNQTKGRDPDNKTNMNKEQDQTNKNNCESLENKEKRTDTNNVDQIKKSDENDEPTHEQTVSGDDLIVNTPEDYAAASDIQDEDEAPTIRVQHDNSISSEYNSIFFHTSIFFLWCIVAIINIPAVLTWAHNFKFNKYLSPDDSFLPGLALSLCAFPLWHFEFPRERKQGLNALGVIISIVSLLCLMFATVSLYRLNFLLTFVIVIVTLHQLFAPQEAMTVEGSNDKNEFAKQKYEEIKKKLD